MSDRDRKLTAAEVANHLRVSPETILQWAREERIPAYRASRKAIRFDLSEVLAAIRSGRAGEGVGQ